MSIPKTVKTPKGTELPLLNLKNKAYLMGCYRLQWFNEEVSNFTIKTEFLNITDTFSIAKAEVTIYDDNGKIVKQATATKKEDKAGFADFLEKSESSAIYRCLAMLGFGTQFALSDLDEGVRIVDTPVVSLRSDSKESDVQDQAPSTNEVSEAQSEVPKKKWKPGKKEAASSSTVNDNW